MSRHVEYNINRFFGTTDITPSRHQARDINVNCAALQSTKDGYAICVTEKIKIIIIMCKEDLCEDCYDSDGNIGPFLYVV